MSRTIRVLADGSLISPGSTPANIANGVIGYVQNPLDIERLTLDFKGWLNGETISQITWTGASLTVGSVTTSSPTSYAPISAVPESGSGTLDIECISSGGREKNIHVRFYGFNPTGELAVY